MSVITLHAIRWMEKERRTVDRCADRISIEFVLYSNYNAFARGGEKGAGGNNVHFRCHLHFGWKTLFFFSALFHSLHQYTLAITM